MSVQVVEVLAGGLCPGEHVLMIPHGGNQRQCLQLVCFKTGCHAVQHWDSTADICY